MSYHCKTQGHLSRSGGPVDAIVIGLVVARLGTDEVRAQFSSDRDSKLAMDLRMEAIELQNTLDRFLADYASGDLPIKDKIRVSKPVEAQLAQVNKELADIGRASALAEILGSPDPGQAWLDHPDIWLRAKVLDELAVVTLHRAPHGPRFSAASVSVEWRKADALNV